jgi:hypothetical protein
VRDGGRCLRRGRAALRPSRMRLPDHLGVSAALERRPRRRGAAEAQAVHPQARWDALDEGDRAEARAPGGRLAPARSHAGVARSRGAEGAGRQDPRAAGAGVVGRAGRLPAGARGGEDEGGCRRGCRLGCRCRGRCRGCRWDAAGAAAAWAAAWDAAGAAAGDAAGAAAGAPPGLPPGMPPGLPPGMPPAAGAAAWAAAWAAAGDAAWDAAWAAAWAAAAKKKLEPTKISLQASAFVLLDKLIELGAAKAA